ncbi:hypothetical protein FGO68_gene7781 [Halteria grandinella]|uniref:Uncharacterized protein n=1 Tax=Halteria grandinella TaxID=5974 RepID=A0A8J8T4G5_HALGN|nr:hypothetical protein FGO68_gene7781 [Halteria grandinella]
MAFERQNEEILSHDKRRKMELQNKQRQELIRQQNFLTKDQNDLFIDPKLLSSQQGRFKFTRSNITHLLDSADTQSEQDQNFANMMQAAVTQTSQKYFNLQTLTDDQRKKLKDTLEKKKNYNKFQNDLEKKVNVLKNSSLVVGEGQLSQATRVHYTAVNPYKDLQRILQKERFLVPQLSSKKTTGYSFGLSVERVLLNNSEEEEQSEQRANQQRKAKKNRFLLQNNVSGAVTTREKIRRKSTVCFVVPQDEQVLQRLPSLKHEPKSIDERAIQTLQSILQKRSNSVASIIKMRKKLDHGLQEVLIQEEKIKQKRQVESGKISTGLIKCPSFQSLKLKNLSNPQFLDVQKKETSPNTKRLTRNETTGVLHKMPALTTSYNYPPPHIIEAYRDLKPRQLVLSPSINHSKKNSKGAIGAHEISMSQPLQRVQVVMKRASGIGGSIQTTGTQSSARSSTNLLKQLALGSKQSSRAKILQRAKTSKQEQGFVPIEKSEKILIQNDENSFITYFNQ